jgi:hypothetical protein
MYALLRTGPSPSTELACVAHSDEDRWPGWKQRKAKRHAFTERDICSAAFAAFCIVGAAAGEEPKSRQELTLKEHFGVSPFSRAGQKEGFMA